MCGRYAFKLSWRELHDLLEFGIFPERLEHLLRASYNIAPTQPCPIVFRRDSDRVLELARWGFTPAWWTQPEPPKHTINARSESVATSRLFRAAFKSGRCIVPASGYFEWQLQPDGSKQPFYIFRADGAPLCMAGIHDRPHDGETFAILTTHAPHGLESLHDRSPVILEREHFAAWLDPATPLADIQALCRPAADGVLAFHPVSKAVGNPRNNSPELIQPAPPAPG